MTKYNNLIPFLPKFSFVDNLLQKPQLCQSVLDIYAVKIVLPLTVVYGHLCLLPDCRSYKEASKNNSDVTVWFVGKI